MQVDLNDDLQGVWLLEGIGLCEALEWVQEMTAGPSPRSFALPVA